jgi:predicted transcriptional regulator of viral defense system
MRPYEPGDIFFMNNLSAHKVAGLEELIRLCGAHRAMMHNCGIIEDELFSFQSRYSSTIFSHETALYLHGLTDRTPLTYSISVPSGYHSEFLNNSGHKIFYVSRDLFDLGITSMNTPHGNQVRTTDLERTICDIVRSRNQIDIQVRNAALKGYVRNQDRNLDRLYRYAKRLHIQSIVREYLEILL